MNGWMRSDIETCEIPVTGVRGVEGELRALHRLRGRSNMGPEGHTCTTFMNLSALNNLSAEGLASISPALRLSHPIHRSWKEVYWLFFAQALSVSNQVL